MLRFLDLGALGGAVDGCVATAQLCCGVAASRPGHAVRGLHRKVAEWRQFLGVVAEQRLVGCVATAQLCCGCAATRSRHTLHGLHRKVAELRQFL